MKKIFILVLLAISFTFSSLATAKDIYVNGYDRKDGTYVEPHYRSAPDSTRNNNFSTRGNTNPYTGEVGTKPRDNYYNNYNNMHNNRYNRYNR